MDEHPEFLYWKEMKTEVCYVILTDYTDDTSTHKLVRDGVFFSYKEAIKMAWLLNDLHTGEGRPYCVTSQRDMFHVTEEVMNDLTPQQQAAL